MSEVQEEINWCDYLARALPSCSKGRGFTRQIIGANPIKRVRNLRKNPMSQKKTPSRVATLVRPKVARAIRVVTSLLRTKNHPRCIPSSAFLSRGKIEAIGGWLSPSFQKDSVDFLLNFGVPFLEAGRFFNVEMACGVSISPSGPGSCAPDQWLFI